MPTFPMIMAGLIAAAAMIRLMPHFFAPQSIGVDHWFWKAYIERYRATREFPPVLPQFLLDEHQWYPPLFPLLMAKLREAIFDRYSYLLAVVIDLLRMVMVMATVWLISGSQAAVIGAASVYATTPILVTYNVQLNPRGLGALLLDGIVVLLVWQLWHGGPGWLWAAITVLSGLVLLTHKMTTQLLWFLALSVGLLTADWRLLGLVPLSIASALALSRGFYWKVLRAHWDIVRFWSRNWPWLSAHPVRESPIYGTRGYESPGKYFRGGIRGHLKRLIYIVGFNPWAYAALISLVWIYVKTDHVTPQVAWVGLWLTLVMVFVMLTTYVPGLRCLGNGYLYTYNSGFPAALLVGLIWGGLKHDWIVNIILGLTALGCVIGLSFYLFKLKFSKTLKVDGDLTRALEHLRCMPEGVVMCLPMHWNDVVAYRTGKPVLWGAHGFGFSKVEPIFPIIRKRIRDVVDEYRVRYVLTYKGYLPDPFVDELCRVGEVCFGDYRLHIVDWQQSNGADAKLGLPEPNVGPEAVVTDAGPR